MEIGVSTAVRREAQALNAPVLLALGPEAVLRRDDFFDQAILIRNLGGAGVFSRSFAWAMKS